MNIYQQTIKKYGPLMQIEVLIEEMAELIHVLQKYKRWLKNTPNASVTEAQIIEEGCDVWIMLTQLKYIFPGPLPWFSAWDNMMEEKLKRMKDRLETMRGRKHDAKRT